MTTAISADAGAAAVAAADSTARIAAITAPVVSSTVIRSSSIPSSLSCRMRSSTTPAASLGRLMPRVAHTLKGVSATLGIKWPSEAAAVVEDRIRHGRLEGIEGDLAAFEEATAAVIAAIRTALVQAAAPRSTDLSAVLPLLRRLEALLLDSDGAALDCLLEAQEMLAQALTPEEFAGLTREVQNFAFDAALVELRAIAARFGTAAAGADGAALSDALSRLETMLADGNGAALDCALEAQELLERALGEEEAGALLREVGNFDFDAALVRVRSIATRG